MGQFLFGVPDRWWLSGGCYHDFVKLLPKGVLNGQTIVDAAVDPKAGLASLQTPVANDIIKVFNEQMLRVRDGLDSPEGALAKVHEQATVYLANVKR